MQIINTFVGRTQELAQWDSFLAEDHSEGQAVVVVGKYGMGKTWLTGRMIQQAQANSAIKCHAVRYVMAPGESPGMILRMILDDMFQAARYETGTLDPAGKRFGQWQRLYKELGVFCQQGERQSDADFRFFEQLRFDRRKNIFDQFSGRLKLLADRLSGRGRLLFVIDPELDTLASRVELWTHIVKKLPPKVIFLFAQRYKDSLAASEEFQALPNVRFIPSQTEKPQGLDDLNDVETSQLFDAYLPLFNDKKIDRAALFERFRQYRNHPYAVHSALNLLLVPGFGIEHLPAEPIPAAVCPIQWKGITEHPLHETAEKLLKTYAVLEIPSLDDMVCWVADIPNEQLEAVFADPFLSSLIRSESDGRLVYHHYFQSYIRSLLYTSEGNLTSEAEELHQRAMKGYGDLAMRTINPDPLVVVRLAEHALSVGGPALFATTLCKCSDLFFSSGFYQTYAALIDRALALVTPVSSEAADLLFQLGQLRSRQSEYQAAVKHYEDSLQTARKIPEPVRIAAALFGLGQVSLKSGHLVEAQMWLADARNYYEAGADKKGLAEVLVLTAEVNWQQGHTKEAEQMLNTALHITAEIRQFRQQAKMMAGIYSAWGQMYDQLGSIEHSAEMYHKALDLTKDIYDQAAEAELRSSLGLIFERIGNLKLAEEHLSKAMAIHHDLKLLEHWADDNVRLARIAEMQGRPQLTVQYINQARKMYQQLGNAQKLEELG